MNWVGAFVWGFVATAVLTGLMSASQGLGLSRISLPFILGTIFTPDRDRATLYGALIHFANGWLFAFGYVTAFHQLGRATWYVGLGLGLLHGLLVLLLVLPILPGLHPRMASERAGPTPTRLLQPPGFLGLHYGYRTPLVTVIAHVAYGAMLGAFYVLPGS